MQQTPIHINNADARRLWLNTQGLAATPTGPLDLAALIKSLGFVQLDSIQVVARAQHHILWSRNQNYREPMLDEFLRQDRAIFEHFTHDASVIPTEFYPYWQRQFQRMASKVCEWGWHEAMADHGGLEHIADRIRAEGPLSTKAFDTKLTKQKKMWSRPPHKLALDYLWYAGALSTAYRENFTKFYDLSERVIPKEYLTQAIPEQAQIDWLCQAALERLGFGSKGEIQSFWDATTSQEVDAWLQTNPQHVVPVTIEGADKSARPGFATADIAERIEHAKAPTTRLRILSPFDPAIRDRKRLQHLFGFEYTVEMFVPAAKRRWGYYVYPLLEGSRFVGRIEVKADRKKHVLEVLNLWAEPQMQWPQARQTKLDAELDRLARLVGANKVVWHCSAKPTRP